MLQEVSSKMPPLMKLLRENNCFPSLAHAAILNDNANGKAVVYMYHTGTYEHGMWGWFSKWSCCQSNDQNAIGCSSTDTLSTKQEAERFLKAGEYDKATELYSKVIEVDPSDDIAKERLTITKVIKQVYEIKCSFHLRLTFICDLIYNYFNSLPLPLTLHFF